MKPTSNAGNLTYQNFFVEFLTCDYKEYTEKLLRMTDLSKQHLKIKIDGLNCLLWREDSVTCRANALLRGVCTFRDRNELLSEVRKKLRLPPASSFSSFTYTESALPPYKIRANILKI